MNFPDINPKQISRQLSLELCAGSGPDGRITKKDIETFVPAKAAPVSEIVWVIYCSFLSDNGKNRHILSHSVYILQIEMYNALISLI